MTGTAPPGDRADGRGAVFLSYASEDAPAAERICAALRAAGIEVWFDRSELRGGDAWDAAIRRQIKACTLFVPIISAHTHARVEGYFRLEWKLAVDRSHLIAPDQPFLVPVAIDGTPQDDERIPERFRELQWTRLPGGETPPAFPARVRELLARAAHPESAPTGADAPPAHAAARAQAPRAAAAPARRTLPLLAGGVLLVMLAAVVGYYAVALRNGPRAAPGAAASAAAGDSAEAIPQKSIAVLPFVDLSEKKDQEYFSDGLAEELLDLLAQVPDLRVPARTSSFYFKGRNEDIATIARRLRVAHVLEGSVRRSGDRIRVTAQLIRADNGYHLWSKTYDRDARDVFQVQDEIAGAVVTALKAQLLAGAVPTGRHRTANGEAYSDWLMANKQRERDTIESNREALRLYQRAVALDPQYAAAWAGIADTEQRIADMDTAAAADYERALAAADKAIALAPQSPEGYWARAGLRMYYQYDWAGSAADFRKALELDPNDAECLADYGMLLATLGRTAEAQQRFAQALALDPLSAAGWRQLGVLQLDVGEFAAATQSAEHLAAVLPDSWVTQSLRGRIALAEGRYADALALFRRTQGRWQTIGAALAQHSLGDDAASRAALGQLVREDANTMGYQIAEIHAWRGEPDEAFQWLDRAYARRDGGLTYLRHDRLLASLRGDPRYTALLRRMKLVD